jgi:hypothetical protein
VGDVGSQIDEEALAAFGIPLNAAPPETHLEVWPENEDIVRLFIALNTQWERSGMSGKASGLRYECVPAVMKFLGIRKSRQAVAFHGLRTMERAALEVIHG